MNASSASAIESDAVVVLSDEGLGGVVPFGHAIRAKGLSPVLLTGPAPEARLEKWRGVYDAVGLFDPLADVETIVRAARATAGSKRIAALFSCYDGLSLPAAQAAAALGLPHPDIEGLTLARNKYAMRRRLAEHGLEKVAFTLVNRPEDVAEAVRAVGGGPAIVKPVNGMSSHLVRRVDDEAACLAFCRHAWSRLADSFPANYGRLLPAAAGAPPLDPRRALLMESFVQGMEFNAEILVRDGVMERIALFEKPIVDPNGFKECCFLLAPAPNGARHEEEIWRFVEQCVAALGLDQVTAHVELIYGDDGPALIEINAGRLGGQIIVRAVRLARGVDMIDNFLALQLRRAAPPPGPPAIAGWISTMTVFPGRSGLLTAIDGLDAVGAMPGVREIIPFCGAGDNIDAEDKEIFAVNVLVSDVEPASLPDLYAEICRNVAFHFDGETQP